MRIARLSYPRLDRLLLCLVLCGSFLFPISGQQKIGFIMPEDVDRVDIPFEEYNNLIVIPITINGFLTLKFVLDTGAESAILTEKVFADLLGFHYVRDITMQAPGIMDSLQAHVAMGVQLSLPGGVKGNQINMLVLKEDYLKLSRNLGAEVYGIIGYDIFSRFVINIDYGKHVLHLFRPETFKPRRWCKFLPLEMEGTKPYIRMNIKQEDKEDTVKLMVDTGASHSVLLDVENIEQLALPDELLSTHLGQGLGGEIPGFTGRMDECEINHFHFDNILVSIPIEGVYTKAIKRGSRHGTIGGEMLTRFNVTMDYPHRKLYLSKGARYREPFEFNMSGLTITAEGSNLDSLQINQIRPNTPGDDAGLMVGDYILKINGRNLRNTSLSSIHMLLHKKDGMKIKMMILRGDEKIKKVFRLRRLI